MDVPVLRCRGMCVLRRRICPGCLPVVRGSIGGSMTQAAGRKSRQTLSDSEPAIYMHTIHVSYPQFDHCNIYLSIMLQSCMKECMEA